MFKILKRNHGITLVELIVVIALLGLVLAVGYQFLDFGQTTHASGELRLHVQRDMRIASEYITQEIRYADNIFINPSDKPLGYHYIFIEEDGSIIHRDVAGDEKVLIDGQLDDADYDLIFKEHDDSILEYLFSSGELGYNLDSKVLALNLKSAIKGDTEGSVIQYTKPHTPIWEYVSLERKMWRDFVRDFYQNTIDKAHEDYYGDSVIDTGSLYITIKGTGHAGGGMMFKNIGTYLEDVAGASIDNYTITVDAQAFRTTAGSGGWGILINGMTTGVSPNIIDNGYMFQFDPGAAGFLLRRVKNGIHVNTHDIGAFPSHSSGHNLCCGAIYSPKHIGNENFNIDNFFNKHNDATSDWYDRYKTVINVKRVNGELFLKVKLIDEEGNESNEMLFGDFGSYTLDGTIFLGQKLDFNFWNNWNGAGSVWNGDGSVIGLRSWHKGHQEHESRFYGIDLSAGVVDWWGN